MRDFKTKIGKITIKDGPAQAFLANDSIANVLTGMGGSLDPQSGAFYFVNNLDQSQIEASFRTSWLSKRVHSAIPKDMVRSWRSFRADSADITLLEKEERRLNVRAHTRRAELFSRLYGGACQMLGTGENTQSELRPETIRKGGLKYIHTVGRHEMTAYGLILDPGSPWFLQPESYLVNAGNGVQIPVHPSRMIRHIPSDTPDSVLMQNGGFGDPLLLSLQSTIINADTLQGTFAAIAAKSKVDTVYIPGLTQMASTTQGEEQLKRRVMVAKAFESLLHVKLMDAGGRDGKDSERWETFEAQLTGQPELLMAFLQMVSGASNIPMTRLVGKSPDGLSATGAGDEKNYFDYIGGEQELELRPRLEALDEVLIRSALGDRPDDVWWEWNPLFTVDEKTRAETSKLRAETTAIYIGTQSIPDEVVQAAVRAELIESGEYPNIEQAYADYEAGTLEAIIEVEKTPDDPLIPLDENGNPRQARESRLFAANDIAARLVGSGWTMLDASTEALRLTDATPRTAYVSRPVVNVDELQAWATEQGLGQLQDNLHVTVYATWDAFDWMKVEGDWNQSDDGNITIAPGGVRILEPLGDNYTVNLFTSSQLSWRHESIKRSSETEYPHQDYQPHWSLFKKQVDLTDKEPYRGRIVLGPEKWEEFNP